MSDDGKDDAVDLFGNPVLPLRDRRGRPSFKKTPENQDFVAVRAAAGWSQERIADDMGIDPKTLRKNFSRELHFGLTMVDGVHLDVLMQRSRQGHVPSIKALREIMAASAPRARKAAVGDRATDAERPGKKELALRAAQDVPADFGDIFDRRRRRDVN